jgi:hypothetical protein
MHPTVLAKRRGDAIERIAGALEVLAGDNERLVGLAASARPSGRFNSEINQLLYLEGIASFFDAFIDDSSSTTAEEIKDEGEELQEKEEETLGGGEESPEEGALGGSSEESPEGEEKRSRRGRKKAES